MRVTRVGTVFALASWSVRVKDKVALLTDRFPVWSGFSARLAQLVEHQLDTLGVASSSLAPRTKLRLLHRVV